MIKENKKTSSSSNQLNHQISFREIRYLITSIDSFVFWVGNEWGIGGSEWFPEFPRSKQ
jgi:hypothetical protein